MTTLPPLLAISEGRKVRVRKAPVWRPKESKLHADVAALLRDHCLPEWRWRFINAKASNAREGSIFKKMGANSGWPDFILVSPYGSVRFLELKRIGKAINEDSPQDDFRMWCVQHGVPHVVAWSIDDVLKAFDAWGCLRVKFARTSLVVDGELG